MPKIGYKMRKILAGKSDPHKLGFTVLIDLLIFDFKWRSKANSLHKDQTFVGLSEVEENVLH
jgi:hypothetical protein